MSRFLNSSVALACAAVALASAASERPNIMFILADDVGWGDFRCYNPDGKIPTPAIDRLARDGMRFTDAHAPAALCAPTRYAVTTGNYTWRGRLPGGTWGYDHPPQFLPGQKTIGHLLQSAGYRTGLFGKLHFGGEFERTAEGGPDFTRPMKTGPIQWGFHYSYALLRGHQAPPYAFFENNRVDGDPAKMTTLKRGPLNGGMVPTTGPGLPDWDSRAVGEKLVRKAIAFIDSAKDQPFYIHLSTDGAHGPYTPPDTLCGTPVKDATRVSAHADMVHEVDVIVGRLIEALERRGLLETTLIVVTSDNGGLPADREYGHDAMGGLRGSKSFIWEGGHRVPFVAHWKGRIPAGTLRAQPIGIHDIVPTFVELAGGTFEEDQMLDAVSLVPVLLGRRGDDRPVRPTLLIQSSPGRDAFSEASRADADGTDRPSPVAGGGRAEKRRQQRQAARSGGSSGGDGMAHALREGPWKLVFDIATDAPVALYNLDDDLAERTNLIGDAMHADRVRRMDRLYRDIRSSKRSTPAAFAAPG